MPATPPSKPRHWRWIAAAAVAGLASGAALMAVANRTDEPSASPVASTIGPDEALALAQRCVDRMDIPQGDTHLRPLLPEPAESEVRVFDSNPSGRTTLVTDDTAFALCQDAAGAPLSLTHGVRLATSPESTDVAVETWAWDTETIDVIGIAGSAVASVALEVDGEDVPGAIVDGWFVVSASNVVNTDGASAFRLRWVTGDGTERSERLDLLDPPSSVELCAADESCLHRRLVELRTQALASGATAQVEILEDLLVSDLERGEATSAYVDCVNDSGLGLVVEVGEDLSISTSGQDPDAESERYLTQVGLQETCLDAHLDLVDQAWNLLDAAERIAEG